VRLTAKAKIARDEEIFDSYYQDDHLKAILEERNEILANYFLDRAGAHAVGCMTQVQVQEK
jgi:hypothetical protein